MTDEDRIRAYMGQAKLVLEREGKKETFTVKSITPKDLGRMMAAMGNVKSADDITVQDAAKLMEVVGEIAVDVIVRTWPTINAEEAGEIFITNKDSMTNCIMGQFDKALVSKRGDTSKLRFAKKQMKEARKEEP